MPQPIAVLSKAQIVEQMQGLDLDELTQLCAATSDARGDEQYAVQASKWFNERSHHNVNSNETEHQATA